MSTLPGHTLNWCIADDSRRGLTVPSFATFRSAVESACKNVIRAEPEITHFDTSKCGNTLGRCILLKIFLDEQSRVTVTAV